MDDEIQLINDGDGVALIGNPTTIDRFLTSQGLESRDLGFQRLAPTMSALAAAGNAGSTIAANSGRWVQLTEKSAQALKGSTLMKGTSPGVSRAVVTENGKISSILEIVKGGSILTNPAVLAGAAGIMAQVAMQQAMDEITEYLATIDEKVDDLLRAQKDSVLSDMIGVEFMLDEVMTVRREVGRVSEVTWSKVQGTSLTVARTQAYALRQLDAIAEKLERKSDIGDLVDASKVAELKVQEWLAVLARCFQLQDALAVLELDRILDALPDELDNHRIGLRTARQSRLGLITRSTENLLARMDTAAGTANSKVLLHPIASRAIVGSSNHVSTSVVDFQMRLGVGGGKESVEATRWVDAVAAVKDKVFETGADGVDAAGRLSGESFDRARSLTDKLSLRIAAGAIRRRGNNQDTESGSDLER